MSSKSDRLAKRLIKLKSKGGGGNQFKPNEEPTRIRILPYPHDEDEIPLLVVGFHYNVGGIRTIVCPSETYGNPCPICELAEEIKSNGGKENWKIYQQLKVKPRTHSPVIVRGKESEGVKIWGYGSTIETDLLKKANDTEDWGEPWDLKEGFDLVVSTLPKGHPDNDTKFDKPEMDIKPRSCVAMKDSDQLKKLLSSIPNYLDTEERFQPKTYKELLSIVEQMSDEEYDEDEDNSNGTSVSKPNQKPEQKPEKQSDQEERGEDPSPSDGTNLSNRLTNALKGL